MAVFDQSEYNPLVNRSEEKELSRAEANRVLSKKSAGTNARRAQLCSIAMVITKHPSEALAAYEFSFGHRQRELGLNELVLKPLMVSFAAIVFNVVTDGMAE